MRLHCAGISNEAISTPPIYIDAPDFTVASAGVVCLHGLCDLLNRLGFEAYVSAKRMSGHLHTPQITDAVRDAHSEQKRKPIVLYPEVVDGNPLNGERIVRYLLNKPGKLGPRPEWSFRHRPNEFILHYADELAVPELGSELLYLPFLDRAVFSPPVGHATRSGFLIYCGRARPSADLIPAWAKPNIPISFDAPRTPGQLADLYRTSSGLITFERTAAQHEALLCHCPTVAIPNDHFREFPLFGLYGNAGIGWGASIDQLEWSKATIPTFISLYESHFRATPQLVKERFLEIAAFFS